MSSTNIIIILIALVIISSLLCSKSKESSQKKSLKLEMAEQSSIQNEADWRNDNFLKGKFHLHYPDDIEVLFYDYNSYIDNPLFEKMWVHITKQVTPGVWIGILLNEPQELKSINQNDSVIVRITKGIDMPVFVPPEMIKDKENWCISCAECGFDMVFCSPEVLKMKNFPDAEEGAILEAMTSRCPLCQGTMIIALWDSELEDLPEKPKNVLKSPLYK